MHHHKLTKLIETIRRKLSCIEMECDPDMTFSEWDYDDLVRMCMDTVTAVTGTPTKEWMKPGRHQKRVMCRRICINLIHRTRTHILINASKNTIARTFRCNHATVIHHLKQHDNFFYTNYTDYIDAYRACEIHLRKLRSTAVTVSLGHINGLEADVTELYATYLQLKNYEKNQSVDVSSR